jgi:prepilin-type processing-associated H-X9-DG protein
MPKGTKLRPEGAFSRTELLILIALVVLLVAAFLPALARSKARSSRLNCSNNLKQIGLAFLTWSLDNSDRFPMHVSVTNLGSMEFTASNLVFPHFQVMSNELSTPKILVCPMDIARACATNNYCATNFEGDLRDVKLSYFIGIDSIEHDPSSWLSGDRNLMAHTTPPTIVSVAGTNRHLVWGKEIHHGKGNIGFADGSVNAFASGVELRAALGAGNGTNHLAIP